MDTKTYIESGAIESYVLGLATPEEAAETVLLCSQYPEIKKAVDDFAAELEQHALKNAVTPSAEIKSKLMLALNNEFEEEKNAPVVPISSNEKAVFPSIKRWQFIAAAAILLFIVSAGFNIYYYSNYQNTNNKYQALLVQQNTLQANNDAFKTKLNGFDESLKLIANPDMHVVTLKDVSGKNINLATVYWNTSTKDVYLLQNNLPQISSDKQYQLWAIVNGKPVDAGVIGDCNGLCKLKNIPNAQAFAITLEKAGGSATPTLSAMYVMGKV